MVEKLISRFDDIYGPGGMKYIYFAPGRVNLIGEHTDYNGGHVFPCALTIGTYGVVRPRKDRMLRFYSLNFEDDGMIISGIDELYPRKEDGWANYPKGVIWVMKKMGCSMPYGLDILVYGNIPSGSGLSSSASLDVMIGMMLKNVYGFQELTNIDLALIGQDAENNFNGCNCGIMDQFVSAMGKKNHAIFLDTNTLKYEYVPVKLGDVCLVVVNSKVKHSLVTSAYNERREECSQALKELQEAIQIESLGELSIEQFEAYKEVIKSPVRQKRARHAVYENQRTIDAVKALRENDLETFGKLMDESHCSLRDDYEVSCEEIDFLTDLAWKIPGVLGARITGGGFGGCTVNLVKQQNVDDFIRHISDHYKKIRHKEAEFYVVEIGDGVRQIV